MLCASVVMCWMLCLTTFALAQGTRGTISGKVTDQTGSVIAGATVKLIDVGTQKEIRTVQADANGVYRFLEIEPATYNIEVSADGFSGANFSNVKVEPNRNVEVDAQLGVAGTTVEVVSVSAGQELIDRESSTLGTTVDHRRVEGLPLNGRNVLQLALLQPGVVTTSGTLSGLGIRVNGSRGVENNVTLDGSNNNEVAVGSTTAPQPRPDAIQEFRLLTSNFDAEFGRNTGSIINVVTRGGTSEYHGNARFFYRPTVLSAARYFDKSISRTKDPGDLRRRFERKEFGGNIGGPIDLPYVKNKMFFFFDYEGRRQLIGNTQTLTGLPSALERIGDFSRLGRNVIDPATGKAFPGNLIPASRISSIAKYYLNFLPLPDSSGRAVVGANEITNNDQITARLDYLLSQKHTVNFTASWFNSSVDSPFAFGGANVPGFGAFDKRTTYNYVARETYTISPSLVNSFLAAYARNGQPGVAPQNATSPKEIGFTANFVANNDFAGPPFIRLLDRGLSLGNSIQGPQARVSENFQLQDSLSWSRGNHRFKFGFDGTFYKQDQTFLFINQGIFSYTRTSGGNTSGDDLADFLIGTGPIAIQFGANGLRDYRQSALAFFAQDTWRVRNNLTLSLGLRYEYTSPLTDKFNRVAYYRAGAVSQLLTTGVLRDQVTGKPIIVPAGRKAPVGLVYPGDPDPVLGGTVPDGGIAKDLNNWAPRFGIAYTPAFSEKYKFLRKVFGDRQTVIRLGVGMYYGAIVGDTALQQLNAPGYNGTNAFFFPASGTLADPFAPDPYPNFRGNQGQITNPFASPSTSVFAPLTQFARPLDPNLRTPYTYQYNLTFERAIYNDYVITLSYVGSRGTKLYVLEQINPALGTFFKAPPGRTVPTPTQSNANSRRLNDDVRIGLTQTASAGNSWYNSFQAQVQKRYSKGFLFQAAYTFSKSINDSDAFRDGLDLLNRRATRSLSSNDVPHRFVVSWLYDIQAAKNLSNSVLKRLLDGWGLGGIATFQSGTPFSVSNPFDTVGTGGGIVSLADLGAAFTQVDPRKNDNRAFNANAFSMFGDPATGFNIAKDFRRGTAGVNQFRLANGINNFDLIISKKTRLWSEASQLELRFEFFNAFNHTQFVGVDTNLLNVVRVNGQIDPNRSTFGKFTSAQESRVVQLAARITF